MKTFDLQLIIIRHLGRDRREETFVGRDIFAIPATCVLVWMPTAWFGSFGASGLK